MQTWVTSDLHFDDDIVVKMGRPFESTEHWNDFMLEKINSKVDRHDRLVIAGDFGESRPGYWRNAIRCKTVILVRGNHDNWHKCQNIFGGNAREHFWIKHHTAGHPAILVSHYPHAYWDGSHHGCFHVYGHCHAQREDSLDAIWPERRSMEISPDARYRLYREWDIWHVDEIVNILGAREGHDLVSFYRKNQAWKDFIEGDLSDDDDHSTYRQ